LRVVADLFVADLFEEEMPRDVSGKVRTDPSEVPSTTALRTQTTDGSPSSILCQVFPSSFDPNSWPLRVPK